MKKPNILIVEDEESILEMIALNLHHNNFQPLRAINAEIAESFLKKNEVDLILLDWMLPGMYGIDFLKRIRSNSDTKDTPVMMLTAKNEEANKIEGFDVGADDYLAKPFSQKELIARIKAILRRKNPESIAEKIKHGNLQVNPDSHEVFHQSKFIKLGPTEFKLLYLLCMNKNRVLSREIIVDKIWNNESEIDVRTIDVHVKRLRSTLKSHGIENSIETIRGAGYKLSDEINFE